MNFAVTDITDENIQDYKSKSVQIYQEFIDDTHASQPRDLQWNFQEFISRNGCYFSLIYYEGKLAGFVEFRDLSLKVRDDKMKIEITSIFVREKYRSKGLGGELVNHVIEFAKTNDRDRVVLYSSMELTDAHKFYEKTGFNRKAYFFEMKL